MHSGVEGAAAVPVEKCLQTVQFELGLCFRVEGEVGGGEGCEEGVHGGDVRPRGEQWYAIQ